MPGACEGLIVLEMGSGCAAAALTGIVLAFGALAVGAGALGLRTYHLAASHGH